MRSRRQSLLVACHSLHRSVRVTLEAETNHAYAPLDPFAQLKQVSHPSCYALPYFNNFQFVSNVREAMTLAP